MRQPRFILWLPAVVGLVACSDSTPPPPAVSLVPPVGVTPSLPPDPSVNAPPTDRPVAKPAPPKPIAQTERELYAAMQARAEQGDPEARFEVAMMHLLGKGGADKDRGLAVELLKRAASDGSVRATTNLANLLIGSARDEAFALYEKAGAAGDLDARRHAAFLLAYEENGVTPTQDPARIDKARQYLQDGAAQGDLFAEALLGELLADLGQTPEALRWLRKPALAGVSSAMTRVMTLAAQQPKAVDQALVAKVKKLLEENKS